MGFGARTARPIWEDEHIHECEYLIAYWLISNIRIGYDVLGAVVLGCETRERDV